MTSKVLFKLMDADRDGKITRFELLEIVRSMINVKISEEEV